MVRIAELIHSRNSQTMTECKLIVDTDTSLTEALRKMQQQGCDYIGVDSGNGDFPFVLNKNDILDALLDEIEKIQRNLSYIQTQVDFTQNRQFEQIDKQLRNITEYQAQRFETAMETMSEGLIILDSNTEIDKVNLSAKTLLNLTDKNNVSDITNVLDDLGFRQILVARTGQHENSGEFNLRYGRKILQMRWKRLEEPDKGLPGYVTTIRDITEETAAEKAKNEFIASVSHELRTPLTSIQNAVSNILAGVTGKVGKKTREYLYAMKSDCHRFADLINNLLDMAKLEAGSMPINRLVLNMPSVICNAISKFAEQARDGNVELISQIQGHVSSVYADADRIKQVVSHLLKNALRYTQPGGKITLKTFDSGDNVITVVEDTGVGISADSQSYIFNKFYQIDRQAGPGSNGSGLGLAICRGIITVHGGSIWLESEPGKGSKFYFSLPKIDPYVVLFKHLSILAEKTSKQGGQLALMILSFDIPLEKRNDLTGSVCRVINEILAETDRFMVPREELSIQTEPLEVILVLKATNKQYIETIESRIKKIVKNILNKYCTNMPVLPMMSTGLYPGDSSDIKELEKTVRSRLKRMFDSNE